MTDAAAMVAKWPVVWGRNRLRGKAEGAMFDDDAGKDTLAQARRLLRAQVVAAGVEPTPEYMDHAVAKCLQLYSDGYLAWRAAPDNTVGFVYELAMPSGAIVLMGDERTLALVHRVPAAEKRQANAP